MNELINGCSLDAGAAFFYGLAGAAALYVMTQFVEDGVVHGFRKKHGFDPRVDKETFDLIMKAKRIEDSEDV